MNLRERLLDRLATDAKDDPLISLATAGQLLPGERPGSGVSPSTIYRWGTQGLPLPDGRVAKLAMWRVGRKWVTTRGALADFIVEQQPLSPAVHPATAPVEAGSQPARG